MGDPKKGKKGSKVGGLVLVLLLAAVGVGAVGWYFPDTPVIGDLVHGFFSAGAKGVDKSGVYTVKIASVSVDKDEFKEGEKVDLQVLIKRVDPEGKEETLWDSRTFGERLATVGKDPLSANWSDRPFEIAWQQGEQIVLEVWDRRGLSDTRIAWLKSAPGSKEFPLKGTQSLTLLKDGDTPIAERRGATNQIVFETSRKGDIPPADASK
jgi:hypothetical protein